MTAEGPEQIELRRDDEAALEALASRMREVAPHGGWINVEPEVDPDANVPTRSLISLAFSARGPDAPFLTWTPASTKEPTALGVQHGAGPKVARRLSIPTTWRVAQDHPRRGIVVLVPPGEDDDHRRLLDWLLDAGTEHATVPLTGWWRATVH